MINFIYIPIFYDFCFIYNNNDKYICLVDVPDSVETYIKNRYPGIKIHKVYHEGEKVVLQENTWQERFINVEKYLEIYSDIKEKGPVHSNKKDKTNV